MLAIWSLVPLPFLKLAWTLEFCGSRIAEARLGEFWALLYLARESEVKLLSCVQLPPGSSVHGIFQARVLEWVAISFSRESSQSRDRTWVSYIVGRRFCHLLCGSLNILWHCLSLGLEWKHFIQFCGHCWFFQIFWHIECSIFTASSFRIWNSSTGIPSPPLPLFVVMHFRMSGCLAAGEWSYHRDYLGHEDVFGIVLCILATSSLYLHVLLKPSLKDFEYYFASRWNEVNENWPFHILWPLLSFPNLLT